MKLYSRPSDSPERGDRVVSKGRSTSLRMTKAPRVGSNERETEKPKVSGCAAKRRLRIVDFPEPEGPDITIGRCVCVAIVRDMS